MILIRLIGTGEQHQVRAERRAVAQIICQSVLDEWLAGTIPREPQTWKEVPGQRHWRYTAESQPTDFVGVHRIRIQVFQQVDENSDRRNEERPPDFELVRWARLAQDQPEAFP